MKIKLNSTSRSATKPLWRDSPCSMNYVCLNPSMDGIPRFQIGSIYHKDQVDKAKKVFNQFEKPDLLLIDYRRQIAQASHPKYNTASKKNKQLTQKQKSKTKSMSMSATSHLYQVPTKTDYKYDINGYRAHQFGSYDVKQIQNKVKSAKKYFSFGRRIDLSRPLNFFPGPGTYNVEKQGTNSDRLIPFSRTCGQFHKINLQSVQNPQTQRPTHDRTKI